MTKQAMAAAPPALVKLFFLSWPVFLAAFLAVLGYGFHWGEWVTRSIHEHTAFVQYGARFSPEDAERLEEKVTKEHKDDLDSHVRDLHR